MRRRPRCRLCPHPSRPVVRWTEPTVNVICANQFVSSPKNKGRYIISHRHALQPGRAAEIIKQAVPKAPVDVEGHKKRDVPIPEGSEVVFDTSRSISELGVKYTSVEQSLADMAKAIWAVLEQQGKSKL